MKLKSLSTICIAAAALIGVQSAHAAKAETYYDSKSHIIGVSGNVSSLTARVGSGKIFTNYPQINPTFTVPAPEEKGRFSEDQIKSAEFELNHQKAGAYVLWYLMNYNGSSINEKLLQERAIKNVTVGDYERAEAGFLDTQTILKEDVLPILSHNYIYFENIVDGGKLAYMIFHVNIDQKIMDDVYNSWNNMSHFRSINPTVTFVAGGICENNNEKFQAQLANKIADFAIRGQLITRSRANLTKEDGARVGDRVIIYRQAMDKDGNFYSKRIARARISGWDGDKAHFFRIAGNAGNRKNGDVAVVSRDKRWSTGIEATYQPHQYGFTITGDHSGSFHKSGFYNHFIFEIGMALTDKPDANWQYNGPTDTPDAQDITGVDFKAPLFFQLGFGYGLSKTFLGLFELMPYFEVQGNYAYCMNKDLLKDNNDNKDGVGGFSVRVPVGLRFSINIVYPVQFTAAAGYAFNWGVGGDNRNWCYDYIENMCDQHDIDRKGFFAQAGIRWHF